MSNFTEHWRTQQSLTSQPWNDEIYKRVFNAQKIERPHDESGYRFELDLCLGIDVTLTLPEGMSLYVQEKACSNEHAHYNSITIERYQSWESKEQGDWFRIAADIQLVGYLNAEGTGYERWALISLTALKLASCRLVNRPRWKEGFNTKDGAKASFYWIEANKLYQQCPDAFIAQHGMLTEKNASHLAASTRAQQLGDYADDPALCELAAQVFGNV